jgi:hypothetical protein
MIALYNAADNSVHAEPVEAGYAQKYLCQKTKKIIPKVLSYGGE